MRKCGSCQEGVVSNKEVCRVIKRCDSRQGCVVSLPNIMIYL